MKRVRKIRIEGDLAYVTLTQGYEAIIDASDVSLIDGWNWAASVGTHAVYARRTKACGHSIPMHRVILTAPEDMTVDHINSDGLDNRRSNLRLATRLQNMHNRRTNVNTTSGFKGVYWNKEVKKWRAQIQVNRQRKCLGCFDTPEAAHAAYVEAANRLHGEFARVA